MMLYEHIHFIEVDRKPRTGVWECRNSFNDAVLGIVKWYGPWRKYAYFPSCEAVYSAGCLRDIAEFMEKEAK